MWWADIQIYWNKGISIHRKKKSSIPTGLALETTTAAANNVTVVTSYENALGSMSFKDIKLLSIGLLVV